VSHRRRRTSSTERKSPPSREGGTLHQLKVTLLGSDPPIWRRLLVPSTWTLDDLHEALQRAMGWEGYHVYGFSAGRRRWYMPREGSGVDGMFVGLFTPRPTAYTHTVHLDHVAPDKGSSIVYVYDLGDQWEHDILVEDVLPWTPGEPIPRCLGGERACPPEDCGGIGGYEDIVRAIQDPKHEPERMSREELLEWLPEGYSPESFDLEEINERLSEYSENV